jgi:hypothetical protein
MSREFQRSLPGALRGIRMVRVSTSLIRIDRMAIPVAGRTWGGSKADMTPTVNDVGSEY